MYTVKIEDGYNMICFSFDDGSSAATFGMMCLKHNENLVVSITYADVPDKLELQEGDDD